MFRAHWPARLEDAAALQRCVVRSGRPESLGSRGLLDWIEGLSFRVKGRPMRFWLATRFRMRRPSFFWRTQQCCSDRAAAALRRPKWLPTRFRVSRSARLDHRSCFWVNTRTCRFWPTSRFRVRRPAFLEEAAALQRPKAAAALRRPKWPLRRFRAGRPVDSSWPPSRFRASPK